MDKKNQKSHVEAGITAMKNMLADGSREDELFVMEKAGVSLGALFDCAAMPDNVRKQIDIARDALETASVWLERGES